VSYRQIDHTGDLAVEVRAPSREELFAEALAAMTDCVTDLASVGRSLSRRLEAEAPDLELLLVEWLGEVLYAFEVHQEVYSCAEVEIQERGDGLMLQARVEGELYDPDRHPLKVPIKGVTYHALKVESGEHGWTARVVFDI
jgi:SHS2 domain-containing protein